MKKKKTNLVKESFIFMILLILIMLILAVALYDFVPSNISIPKIVEYTADSETTSIKQEIAYTNGGDVEEENEQELITSLKSYSIEASDLTVYGEKNLYNSGNSNPFDYAEETVTQPTENTTTEQKNNNEGNNQSNQTNTTAPASGTTTTAPTSGTTSGTFFEKPSTK